MLPFEVCRYTGGTREPTRMYLTRNTDRLASPLHSHHCNKKYPHIARTRKRATPSLSPPCLLPPHHTFVISSNTSNNTWQALVINQCTRYSTWSNIQYTTEHLSGIQVCKIVDVTSDNTTRSIGYVSCQQTGENIKTNRIRSRI